MGILGSARLVYTHIHSLVLASPLSSPPIGILGWVWLDGGRLTHFGILFLLSRQGRIIHKQEMAVRILVREGAPIFSSAYKSHFCYLPKLSCKTVKRGCSFRSSLEPPDVARLAETARISLTPQQVEKFGPKIQQVVDWFGQLQVVDLESVEPAIRADIEGDNLREDLPKNFGNREAIIAAIPSYEEPYIKVPKVLNKE
ncbi:hypothetical protein Dimus_010577 [Dionaea muscipula]